MKLQLALLAGLLGAVAHDAGAEPWVPYLQEWVGNPGEHSGSSIAIDGYPGDARFIYVGVPDTAGRRRILAIHTEGMPLADDVDLEKVAQRTDRFTGGSASGRVEVGIDERFEAP